MPMPIETRLNNASLLVENVLANPDLLAVFETAGHDAAYFAQAREMIARARTLALQQRNEYAESGAATQSLKDLRDTADGMYKKHLRWARHLFKGDAHLERMLELKGKRVKRYDGWLRQASSFYDNLLGDEDVVARMTESPLTREELEAAREAVAAVELTYRQRENEAGQAEQSTVERDRVLEEMDAFWRDETALARLLFTDDPQQLERLGLFARS